MNVIRKFLLMWKLKKNNNKIYILKENGEKILFPEVNGLNFNIKGTNNIVELRAPLPTFSNCIIWVNGDNSLFSLGGSPYGLWNTTFKLYTNSLIDIGNDFSCAGGLFECSSYKKITIGNDCLFSTNLYFRTDDGHAVIDQDTKEPLNTPKDISIGNHVWAGYAATFLKGARILDNCIVAAHAIINKSYNIENAVLTGVRGGVVKHSVSWVREDFLTYKSKYLKGIHAERIEHDFNNFTNI